MDRILVSAGIANRPLDADLRARLRHPRHLRQALKHWAATTESGDFTAERLIYEEWRDFIAPRLHQPLSRAEFERLLIDIAKRRHDALSRSELAQLLGGNPQAHAALEELISHQVLEPQAGLPDRFFLERNRLLLALALLLLEQLSETANLEEAMEKAAAALEPGEDSDDSSLILANAVCIALTSSGPHAPPRDAILALLLALARHRNGADAFQRAQPWVYYPEKTEIFRILAEHEWERGRDARSKERIGYCFVLIAEKWPTHPALASTCRRWTSLIHIESARLREAISDEEMAAYRQGLAARLEACRAVTDAEGITPQGVPRVSLLHLSDLAFLVISASIAETGPHEWHTECLKRWAFSRAIMCHPFGATEARWIARLAGPPLAARVREATRRLAAHDDPWMDFASTILLEAVGGPGPVLDGDPVPVRVPPSTERSQVQSLPRRALDPNEDLEAPPGLLPRLLRSIELADVCVGNQMTSSDLALRSADAALSRLVPRRYARFALRAFDFIAGTILTQSNLRTHTLSEYFLLLNRRRLLRARALGEQMEATPPVPPPSGGKPAWDLGGLVLAGLTSAEQQRRFLLDRADPDDNADWEDLLAPLERNEVKKLWRLLPSASGIDRRRLVWPSWKEPVSLTPAQRRVLRLASADPAVGNLAVLPSQRARDPELLNAAIQDGLLEDDLLSIILKREPWARSAWTSDQEASLPPVGQKTRSWTVRERGLSPSDVHLWVTRMDEELRNPGRQRALLGGGAFAIDTIEAAIQLEPRTTGQWIEAVGQESGLSFTLVDLNFDLVSALVVALLNQNDPRGVECFIRLLRPRILVSTDGATDIPSLWFLPFRAGDTEGARKAAKTLFEQAFNDDDLQKLAFVATHYGRFETLVAAIETDTRNHDLQAERILAVAALAPYSRETMDRIERYAATALPPHRGSTLASLAPCGESERGRRPRHRSAPPPLGAESARDPKTLRK